MLNNNIVTKVVRLKFLSFGLMLILVTACSNSVDTTSEAQQKSLRFTRQHLLQKLYRANVNFRQDGEQLAFVMPVDALFQPGSSVPQRDAKPILKDVVHFINTYHIETLTIDVFQHGRNSNSYALALGTKQAQIAQDLMHQLNVAAPIIASSGHLYSDAHRTNGLGFKRFIVMRFKFIPR